MNKGYIYTLFLSLCVGSVLGQSSIEWSRTIGGSANEHVATIIPISEQQLMVFGSSASNNVDFSSNNGQLDAYGSLLDTQGNILWTKSYGGSKHEVIYDAISTTSDEFILVGTSYSSDGDINNLTQHGDGFLLKIDMDGNLLWSMTLGGNRLDEIRKIITLQDGNYLMVGTTSSDDFPENTTKKGYSDGFVIKINASGNIIWQKRFGGSRSDQINDVLETSSGQLLLVGSTFSDDGDFNNSKGNNDGFVMALGASGSLLWSKLVGNETTNEFQSIVATLDDQYVLTGFTGIINYDTEGVRQDYDEEAWLWKMDAAGNEIWSKTYGGTSKDRASSTIITLDGGLLTSASSSSFDGNLTASKGKSDVWIYKTDINGNLEWQRNYGGSASEFSKNLIQTSDGSYYIATETMSSDGDIIAKKGNIDTWILKLEGTYQLNVSLGLDQSICTNESLTLSANSACSTCTFLWEDGTTASSRTVTPTSSTTYTVTITDENGLTDTDDILITVFDEIEANVEVHPIDCFGQNNGNITVTPTTGTAPYNYIWNNNSNDAFIDNLPVGLYELTLTDANGCSGTFEVAINQPSQLNTAANIVELNCSDSQNGAINTQITGGTPPYAFDWNNGQTSQNIQNLNAGFYELTATDANGCSVLFNTTIDEISALEITGNTIQIDCFNDQNGVINTQISGGTPPYSFLWNNGQTSQNIQNLDAGFYELTATDANGCSVLFNTTIDEISALEITGNTIQIDCFNDQNGVINTQISGGTPPYSFLWNNGQTSQNIQNLDAGFYELTATDANGCSILFNTTIDEISALEITGNTTQIDCFNEQNGAINTQITGGTPPYAFDWNNGQTLQNIQNLDAGVYELLVTDANGCTLNFTTFINTPEAISLTSTVNPVSCFGNMDGNITLIPTGGTPPYEYQWSNNSTNSNLSNIPFGTYDVTVTDQNSCSQIENFIIETPDSLTNNVVINQPTGGANGQVFTDVSGGTVPYDYLWNTGDTTANIENLISGIYDLTITDSNGCLLMDSFELENPNTAYSTNNNTLFKIYPNPTQDVIFIEKQTVANSFVTVALYDLLGQKILEENISPSNNLIRLPLKKYASGTYLLVLQQRDERQIERIILE